MKPTAVNVIGFFQLSSIEMPVKADTASEDSEHNFQLSSIEMLQEDLASLLCCPCLFQLSSIEMHIYE